MSLVILTCLFYVSILGYNTCNAMSIRDTGGGAFSTYPKKIELHPDVPLMLPWRHRLLSSKIRWCNWQHRPMDGDNSWTKFIGYDKHHSRQLNITDRCRSYEFIDKENPCQNGIWSMENDISSLIGSYRMMVIMLNGSVYTSSETIVSRMDDPVCDVCNNVGLNVAVVVLTLLLVTGVILVVLYYKGKLPQKCLKQINQTLSTKEKKITKLEAEADDEDKNEEDKKFKSAMKEKKKNKKHNIDPSSQMLLDKHEVKNFKELSDKLEHEKGTHQNRIISFQQTLASNKEEIDKLKAENQEKSKELEMLRSATKEKKKSKKPYIDPASQMPLEKHEVKNFKELSYKLEHEKGTHQKKIISFQQTLAANKAEIAKLVAENQDKSKELEMIRSAMKEKVKGKKDSTAVDSYIQDIFRMINVKNFEELATKLDSDEKQINTLQEREKELEEEIKQLHADNAKMREDYNKQQEELTVVENTKGAESESVKLQNENKME